MQRYFDSLTRFAYYLVGSRDAAEDVVQEVFVRLWEQRATVDPSRSLRAFLFRSVRNQALNDLKHRHVRERYQALVADEAAHDEAVGTVPSGEDALLTHATYEAGVRALSPRHQQVLRLRLEEQLSYAELAEALELSSKAAEQLFLRALTALRRRLHEKSRP